MILRLKSRAHLASLAKRFLQMTKMRLNTIFVTIIILMLSTALIAVTYKYINHKCHNEIEYEGIKSWDQSDHRLIDVVREKIIMPPPMTVPYNFSEPLVVEQSQGQIHVIKELFKNVVRPRLVIRSELVKNVVMGERRWSSGMTSDSGTREPGFEPHSIPVPRL